MKLIITILAALSLSGCYQSINKYDMQRAIKACGSYENIAEIYSAFTGDESVLCNDGVEHRLSSRR